MPKNQQNLLGQLEAQIKKLARKNDPAARLDVYGAGPVARIARAINQLQHQSERRSAKLRDVAESFQQTFWVLEAKRKRVTFLNGHGDLPTETDAWITAAYPDDRAGVRSMLEKHRHGEAGQIEFRVSGPEGNARWLWCRYLPVAGPRGWVARTVGVFEDITEQKEAEQILTVSQNDLRDVIELRHSQKLQSVGELMGGIAHEINTPVQFVGDNLLFLREALPKIDQLLHAQIHKEGRNADLEYLQVELPKAVEQAQEGVTRVAKLAKTLKEYSREQKDQGRKAANLNQALESTLLIARNAVKYVADVETSYGALPMVNCHLGDIQQVLLDLIVRAAHAIEEVAAKTKERGQIRVETKPAGDWVVISISDSGETLSRAAQQEIFAPANSKGLGVAHAIVTQQHGGTLTCSSESGKGNTFSIRLPVLGKQASSSFAVGAG